jgi:putative endonuclease
MKEHRYYVYLISSRTRVLYCGMTSDIRVRVVQHKNGVFAGFSSDYKCHRLVWFERYQEVNRAIDREKQIKRWRREKKLALINDLNPSWVDLSEDWFKPLQLYKTGLNRDQDLTAGPSAPAADAAYARDDRI